MPAESEQHSPTNGIARKLIVLVVLFSSLITLVTTAGQLFSDYRDDVDKINSGFDQIRTTSLQSVAESVWLLDDARLDTLLRGLARLPDITHLSIVLEGKVQWEIGQTDNDASVSQEFPLYNRHRNEEILIGTLIATASLGGVYERLIDRAAIILVSNAVKTFLVSGFVLVLFQVLVTRHLVEISDFARSIGKGRNVPDLALARRKSSPENQDELDFLTEAVNDMRRGQETSNQKLQYQEERFRDFADVSSDWLWEMDADLQMEYSGDLSVFDTGIQSLEVPGGKTRFETLKKFLPDWERIDEQKWQAHDDDLNAHRPFSDFRYSIFDLNGDLAAISISGKPVFDRDGIFQGYRGSGKDITPEINIIDNLRKSEAKYRAFFSNAQVGIIRSRMEDGKVFDANARAAEILGYSSVEELIARHQGNHAWINPEDRERAIEEVRKFGAVRDVETEFRRPNGPNGWARASLNFDSEDQTLVSVIIDITDKKNAEAALERLNDQLEERVAARTAELTVEIAERQRAETRHQESEARLRTAIDSIDDGFVLYDADDRLVLWNKRITDYAPSMLDFIAPGVTFEEFLRAGVERNLYVDGVERGEDWIQERLREHLTPHEEMEIQLTDGRWFRFVESITPDGGRVGLRTDITALKTALQDLEAAQGELIRQERLATLGQVTATVSHELRNPLGAMRSSTYFLRHSIDESDQKGRQAIERIERSVVRCDRIIGELLDYTRIRDVVLEPITIDTWLKEVLDEQSRPSTIDLVLHFNAGNSCVHIDEDYLRRAVINLFENACQSMSDMEGSENLSTRQLTVTTCIVSEGIEISFSDTGVGVPDELQEKIFEPMFSTKGFGVGLGLAVVREIVEHHHGSIKVAPNQAGGTTMTIGLPLQDRAQGVA
jgi:PAS domain S-box-containing protein